MLDIVMITSIQRRCISVGDDITKDVKKADVDRKRG
jgi:hypothetical protein